MSVAVCKGIESQFVLLDNKFETEIGMPRYLLKSTLGVHPVKGGKGRYHGQKEVAL